MNELLGQFPILTLNTHTEEKGGKKKKVLFFTLFYFPPPPSSSAAPPHGKERRPADTMSRAVEDPYEILKPYTSLPSPRLKDRREGEREEEDATLSGLFNSRDDDIFFFRCMGKNPIKGLRT